MPNLCNYDMKIRGSKKAIKRVIECLKAGYNYTGGGKPYHKHFFRVFDVYDEDEMEDNGDGTFTQYLFGTCAWSVHSCMLEGGSTYYSDCKKAYSKIFMGTSLREQSKDCEIEVFSEEEGMCFSEHYLFKNGKCLCDDCIEIQQGGYDEDGKPTTDIDWDTYDGDTFIFNDYREGIEEGFAWTI